MSATLTGQWRAIQPGSPEWLPIMTASKVSAVLGVNPWESARSLWHKMRGDVPAETQTTPQARGHYLEPAVLAWFFDQHPELVRRRYDPGLGGTFVRDGWMGATPDAEAVQNGATVPVEAKSAADLAEWGTPGTDEIPVYYAAQCMWTMHVLQASRIFVPMIGPYLEFAEYLIEYDPATGEAMEAKCRAFIDSLTGDTPPAVDDNPVTYQVLRKVNPTITEGVEVQLSTEHARLYVDAKRLTKQAEQAMALANATIAEQMGTAQRALYGQQLIARRQNTSTGTAALYPARTLPDLGATA